MSMCDNAAARRSLPSAFVVAIRTPEPPLELKAIFSKVAIRELNVLQVKTICGSWVERGPESEYRTEEENLMTNLTSSRFDHTEGKVARSIEEQTAKLPSDTFLWAAVASMAASATLQAMGNKHASVFVGQWAPTLLILGLYNKLVKQLGSDYRDVPAR